MGDAPAAWGLGSRPGSGTGKQRGSGAVRGTWGCTHARTPHPWHGAGVCRGALTRPGPLSARGSSTCNTPGLRGRGPHLRPQATARKEQSSAKRAGGASTQGPRPSPACPGTQRPPGPGPGGGAVSPTLPLGSCRQPGTVPTWGRLAGGNSQGSAPPPPAHFPSTPRTSTGPSVSPSNGPAATHLVAWPSVLPARDQGGHGQCRGRGCWEPRGRLLCRTTGPSHNRRRYRGSQRTPAFLRRQ